MYCFETERLLYSRQLCYYTGSHNGLVPPSSNLPRPSQPQCLPSSPFFILPGTLVYLINRPYVPGDESASPERSTTPPPPSGGRALTPRKRARRRGRQFKRPQVRQERRALRASKRPSTVHPFSSLSVPAETTSQAIFRGPCGKCNEISMRAEF